MARGADRRDVVGLHVLHLVDEQRNALADVGGEAGHVAEQFDQVDLRLGREGNDIENGRGRYLRFNLRPGLAVKPRVMRGGASAGAGVV